MSHSLISPLLAALSAASIGPLAGCTDGFVDLGRLPASVAASGGVAGSAGGGAAGSAPGEGAAGAPATGIPATPSAPVPASWGGLRVVLADDFNDTTLAPLWAQGLANQGYGDAGYSKGTTSYEQEIFWPAGVVMGARVGRPSEVILKATPEPQGVPGYGQDDYPTTNQYASGAFDSYIGTGTGFAATGFQWDVASTPLVVEAKIAFPGSADLTSPWGQLWLSSAEGWTFSEAWAEQARARVGSDVQLQSATDFISGAATSCNRQAGSGPWSTALQPAPGVAHVYTTVAATDGSFTVYVDGSKVTDNPPEPTQGASMGIIFEYALWAPPPAAWAGDEMVIDYVVAWQPRGVAAGVGIHGGGVAPKTVVP